jgi:multidrug efflux system membrane fusion protein
VSERQRGSLEVDQIANIRFIDGKTVNGTVSFVSLSADKATRTYRVEARMPNPSAEIADGVTCEMTVTLAPMQAAAVPRSALVFSDAGALGVRIADDRSLARFVPVALVDDGRETVWVTGIDKPTRVIVVGQDFVKDGDPVEAVTAADAAPVAIKTEPPA